MANPNIFQQYLQAPRSALDYAADLDRQEASRLALESARNKNALDALAMQQSAGDRNALERAAAAAGGDQGKLVALLESSGRPGLMALASERRKAMLDQRNVESQIGERGAKTEADRYKLERERQQASMQLIAGLNAPQDALGALDESVRRGEIPAHVADLLRKTIPSDPAQFGQWKLQMIVGLTSPEKMVETLRPMIQARDTGGAVQTLAIDQMTGRPTVTGSVPKAQSPDSVASNATQRRGQDLADARERALSERTVTYQTDASGNLVALPSRVAAGQVVQPIPVSDAGGRPMQGKQSEAVQKERMAINQMRSLVASGIEAAQETPSAFGTARGLATMAGSIPESAAGKLMDTDAESQARAFIFNNVSAVINERAGAAQSKQELARLRSFLPSETDDSRQVVNKLKAFQRYLDEKERGTTARQVESGPKTAGGFKIIGVK